MAKQVVDFRASAGITTNQSNEHQRRWSDRSWNVAMRGGNYDRTRDHLNFEIAKGGIVQPIDKSVTIPQRIRETLKARGIVDPNEELRRKGKTPNRRTLVNIIFGGSRERMHEIAFGNQTVDTTHGADNSHITRSPDIEEWAKDIYKFACDKWGEDNIVGFYVHLDELNPHIHCSLLPITQRNKFSFKELFAGKDKIEFKERTLQLHNELAVVNAKWGLDRGQSIMETGARHRSTEQYRYELRKENNELEVEISAKHETLRDLYADINKAEKRCKGLKTMIRNLENREAELTAELSQLQAELDAGTGNAADLHRRIAELEEKLRSTTSSLVDKRQKLKVADRQLVDLNSEMDAVKQNTAELLRQREGYKEEEVCQMLLDKNGELSRRADKDARALAELKKIMRIEGLLSRYGHIFRQTYANSANRKTYPVNDYSSLNALRARLNGGADTDPDFAEEDLGDWIEDERTESVINEFEESETTPTVTEPEKALAESMSTNQLTKSDLTGYLAEIQSGEFTEV